MNKLLSIILLLLLVSCAGALMQGESDEKDLVEIFENGDRETLEKFKTENPVAEPSLKSATQEPTKEEKEIVKKEKAKEKKLKEKVTKKKIEKKEEKTINPQTLDDYPEQYIAIDEKSKEYWKSYRPMYLIGEEFKFEIGWSIFKAGTATIRTMPMATMGGKEVLHVNGLLESAEYFEGIYKLKDTLDVYVDIEKGGFSPLKYEMKQRESGQLVDDLQLFDHDKLKTYFFYHRLKDGKTKNKKIQEYLPRYFTDSFSALYFLRGLPMKIGSKFEFPIVTRGKVWILKAEVDNVEEVEVMNKKFQAYRITAQTQFPGVLKKSGDINFWFSTDESRMLLKFAAKIKIGAVKGELISHKKGEYKK
ncbi:DUF3108 domain-containing protein [Halobacteriovorax sp.]|uniref:DUF3108 domain-containing protein n=1 Tax=Halobacteriovorax sp. TaxID=2020862 RepID=UPI003AF281BC